MPVPAPRPGRKAELQRIEKSCEDHLIARWGWDASMLQACQGLKAVALVMNGPCPTLGRWSA